MRRQIVNLIPFVKIGISCQTEQDKIIERIRERRILGNLMNGITIHGLDLRANLVVAMVQPPICSLKMGQDYFRLRLPILLIIMQDGNKYCETKLLLFSSKLSPAKIMNSFPNMGRSSLFYVHASQLCLKLPTFWIMFQKFVQFFGL